MVAEPQQRPLNGFLRRVMLVTLEQTFNQPHPVARLVGRELHGGGIMFDCCRITLLAEQFRQFIAPGALMRFMLQRLLEDLARLVDASLLLQ